MDIIYCAFILFNNDGSHANNDYVLKDIATYVMPNAKEHGNIAVEFSTQK